MARSHSPKRSVPRLLGATVVTVGTTWLANHVVGRLSAKPKTKPAAGELEPWEREALDGGSVGAAEGVPHQLVDAMPVGRGHPSEHCVTLGAGDGDELDPHCVFDPLEDPRFAPVDRGAPAAGIPSSSSWPVLTKHPSRLVVSYWTIAGARGYSGRAFAAERVDDDGSRRKHAGVDLFARAGDVVVAPEDGRVLAVLPFHAGTWAVYLRSMLGDRVVNLGEVEKLSWREFGVAPGQSVVEGQPLARIGVQDGGSTMLHLETYAGADESDEQLVAAIRGGAMSWAADQAAPARLRDPSGYLLIAASRTYRRGLLT